MNMNFIINKNLKNILEYGKNTFLKNKIYFRFCEDFTRNSSDTSEVRKKKIYKNLNSGRKFSKISESNYNNSASMSKSNFQSVPSQTLDTKGPNNSNKFNSKSPLSKEEDIQNYFDQLLDFNKDFTKLKPSSIEDKDNAKEEDDDSFQKLSHLLATKRVRQVGSNYIIDLLTDIYKKIIGVPKDGKLYSAENFYEREKIKKNKKLEKKVSEVFSSNEIIDSLNLIVRHLGDLKLQELDRLINILVKVKYSNFENWKKILRQFLLSITLLDTGYTKPTEKKRVVQILQRLKEIYEFLPFKSDQEIQTLLERSIEESVNFLLRNFNTMDTKAISSTLSSIGKLGLLNEEVCRKIEEPLIDIITDENIEDLEFSKIFFSIYKNRCPSSKLRNAFEKKIGFIINRYAKNSAKIDSDSLYIITRGLYFYYKSSDKTNPLFLQIEDIIFKNEKLFDFDHLIYISFCLLYLSKPSEDYYKLIDRVLDQFNDTHVLTEFLLFQIISISLRRNEISLQNMKKYISAYISMIKNNQVNTKEVEMFRKSVVYRKNRGRTPKEIVEYLEEVLGEIKDFSLVPQKINF